MFNSILIVNLKGNNSAYKHFCAPSHYYGFSPKITSLFWRTMNDAFSFDGTIYLFCICFSSASCECGVVTKNKYDTSRVVVQITKITNLHENIRFSVFMHGDILITKLMKNNLVYTISTPGTIIMELRSE